MSMPIGEIVSGLKGLKIMLWILDDKVHVNQDTSKGLLIDVLGKVEGLMTLWATMDACPIISVQSINYNHA
jgi:hypothetical protein